MMTCKHLVHFPVIVLLVTSSWALNADKCCKNIVDECSEKNRNCCGSKDYHVVCYFINWAWYRSDGAKFLPSDIPSTLCTHVIYAFTGLNATTLTMQSSDPWADIDNKFYELVVAFKKYAIKVLISLGGWNDSAGDKYHRLFSNKTARKNFVKGVKEFLEKYDFDGMDMDLEYPGCPWGNTTSETRVPDINHYSILLRELKDALPDKYLSVTTPCGERLSKKCYNMTAVCEIADFINVMCYDFYSYADGITGPNADFCNNNTAWGTVQSIDWYRHGAHCPASKIHVGVPFYSKTFNLVNASPVGFGVPVDGPGPAGTYTKEAGTLSYMETCLKIKNENYTAVHTPFHASYAYKGKEFLSYSSTADIAQVACYIKKHKLRGAMVWELSSDDFSNQCGCGRFPLLGALNRNLRCVENNATACY